MKLLWPLNTDRESWIRHLQRVMGTSFNSSGHQWWEVTKYSTLHIAWLFRSYASLNLFSMTFIYLFSLLVCLQIKILHLKTYDSQCSPSPLACDFFQKKTVCSCGTLLSSKSDFPSTLLWCKISHYFMKKQRSEKSFENEYKCAQKNFVFSSFHPFRFIFWPLEGVWPFVGNHCAKSPTCM